MFRNCKTFFLTYSAVCSRHDAGGSPGERCPAWGEPGGVMQVCAGTGDRFDPSQCQRVLNFSIPLAFPASQPADEGSPHTLGITPGAS